MASSGDDGVERHTTGVIGALELSPPGTDILPHEHTTKKAKSDRLDLLRSCRANLSAIWGLSLAKGLTDLLPVHDVPLADLVDDDGIRHTIWRVDDPETCAAITAAIAEHPVLIADGHHRYETALAYKTEREAEEGDAGEAGATLAYLVELVEDELSVHADPPVDHRAPGGHRPRRPRSRRGSTKQVLRRPTDRSPPPCSSADASRWCSPSARCSCSRVPMRWPRRATSIRAAWTSRSPRSLRTTSAFSTASTTCARRRHRRSPGRGAAATGHRRPDRGHGPRRGAHATQVDVLPPQAQDRRRLPNLD